ncbi:hypothetical protein CANTEDRAFT_129299 [Yamadazyma tenuis ATCC 10573]|uniref:BRCT domain-containing protein n=1 Tax=Candida tenuis (strain ATCC 10573 / BCRC 21748 / CBS 615 / JCM 9827 / NBRC 10315 / NRRL Y-1498 / VKM Y-70) TaxID=590646 RepID=G3AYG3_CANTC|nr:uncharacterized protein CANTEDRAFT_129299 [Yamadazyma tenuis ATCC 10573]EGV65847.1 hypothetical protein CANTEDRAFT_129299 [Yamadazyma tenuis ATCC 10573]
MFKGLNALIVKSEGFQDPKKVDRLQLSIENNGGITYIKNAHDSEDYLEKTQEFIEYSTARDSMIPITTPDWVHKSTATGKALHVTKFNPDPKSFLKECFICIGDDIPNSDKEIIYGGVKAFGGMYLDMLTSYTTHLITTDLENDKSILACSSEVDIKIVTPNWIDDCFKMGRKVSEKEYYLEVDNLADNEQNQLIINECQANVDNMLSFNTSFFNDKKFYISADYMLSKNLRGAINALILKNGGKISSKFTDSIDTYIGKYRHGKEYNASVKNSGIIIGNLQWFYTVVLTNKWILPTNSQLLHYPIPSKPLTAFKNLKISVTNYSHEARYYLSKLITIMGGTFTKNLTKDNDFLIVGKPTGNKYYAAHDKWVVDGEQLVKTVNHLWLEECFANWQVMDHVNPKYTHLGYVSGHGVTRLIGRTKLKTKVLRDWIDFDVDDSMDDGILQPSVEEETDYSNEDEEKIQEERTEGCTKPKNRRITKQEKNKNMKKHLKSKKESLAVGVNTSTPPNKRGRSAKTKAAMKLHDDMEDLVKHQKMLKSSKNLTGYMRELEHTSSKRPNSQDKENITPVSKKQKAFTPEKTASQLSMVAIMTGCESEVDLTREDIANLKNYGIKISSGAGKINCLIAPRILRTEKFLSSLGKVDFILHPRLLIDLKYLLGRGESPEIEIQDYRLDKIISVSEANEQLGYSDEELEEVNGIEQILHSPRGQLFEGYKLNLSANLNGGFEVLSRILLSHGVEELKLVNKTISSQKNLLESDGDKILIVNKTKDAKLIKSLPKNCTFVEWDWCVKSIFKQKIEPFDKYIAN